MSRSRYTPSILTLAFLLGAGSAHAQRTLRTDLTPFLEKYCFDCHTGDSPEAGLDLQKTSTQISDAEVRRRWIYLHDRVATGEMPPKIGTAPSAEAKAKFLQTLGDSLSSAHRQSREVVLRRLNRNEYENTVRDLFGIDVDLSRLLPEDSFDQGFDTTGSALSLSAEQMVVYIDAADVVLDRTFGPPRKPMQIRKSINSKDLRALRSSVRVKPNGVELFNKDGLALYETSARIPGTYKLRVQVQTVQSEKPMILRVEGGCTMRIAPHLEGFFEVPTGKLTTIELMGRAIEPSDNFSLNLANGFPWSRVSPDYKGPGLFVGDIEWEGPMEAWPPPSRARLLGDIDPAKGTLDDVRTVLLQILPRAFRRTAANAEVDPYVALAKQALDDGMSFEKALRRGLKGVLCAPEFLFLEERFAKGQPKTNLRTIDDFALASRLSYFLWSTLPDQQLLSLAESDKLHQPEILHAQVERMLADPKAQRFIENFTGQWLRLRDIDFTVPDRKLYPEYTKLLRQSMLDETHAFFREILQRDRSIQTFIDSDFAMLNGPLAKFYGIEGVEGLRIRRVELPEDSVRGGVLTHASVLKVSADGTRTSPVLRGTWILKHLYGTPAPPPPPTVEAVAPDIRGATTIREELAKHRDEPSCNRCHRKIDPPGFALESFDVLGNYREWYRTSGSGKFVKRLLHPQAPRQFVRYRQGPAVDPSGTMPDGRKFADIREYKQLLLQDETALPRSLTRLLLTYSLGREMGFSDRADIERIVVNVRAKNYGLRSLIHEMVRSETFRSP